MIAVRNAKSFGVLMLNILVFRCDMVKKSQVNLTSHSCDFTMLTCYLRVVFPYPGCPIGMSWNVDEVRVSPGLSVHGLLNKSVLFWNPQSSLKGCAVWCCSPGCTAAWWLWRCLDRWTTAPSDRLCRKSSRRTTTFRLISRSLAWVSLHFYSWKCDCLDVCCWLRCLCFLSGVRFCWFVSANAVGVQPHLGNEWPAALRHVPAWALPAAMVRHPVGLPLSLRDFPGSGIFMVIKRPPSVRSSFQHLQDVLRLHIWPNYV